SGDLDGQIVIARCHAARCLVKRGAPTRRGRSLRTRRRNVFGEPAATEELEDVGWHPIGREALGSFRAVTRFMLARAVALRGGTASGGPPLFYWPKNARRIGVCREAASAP